MISDKLKSLPSSPGVYFHKNAGGEIIYVGKAAVLKNRVRQYFQKTEKDPKTTALVQEIADVDWIVVDTEIDALFLESEMIKRYMPKWNILLRDDKTVSYVRIDMNNQIPFVSMTRTPEDDKATYIGPFYAKSTVEKALRTLRKVFPYYDKPYNGKKTLNTDLGLTPGLEIGKSSPKEYKKSLQSLIRYLKGDRKKLLKDLENQMKLASNAGNFEAAIIARNQLFGLKELQRKIIFSDREFLDLSKDLALKELSQILNLKTPPKRIEGFDISHQSGIDTVASMVVFINGISSRSDYRKFKLKKDQNNDPASMREVVSRRLKHKDWPTPDLIILDGSVGQLSAVIDLLDDAKIPVIARDKSGDHGRNALMGIVIPLKDGFIKHSLSSSSHAAKLIQRIDEEAHRFAITYHRSLRSKSMLK